MVDRQEPDSPVAPWDDEPETTEEIAEVEAARQEIGPGTPHEDVLREFGL